MNTVHWKMQNCECQIAYDYDKADGDTLATRKNHRYISRCQYHPLLDGKELHDGLCLEQTQVAIAQIKIIEIHPELAKDGSIDVEKAVVGLDDKREIVCAVELTQQEKDDLKVTLESVCDRPVKVI